jgi:type II secretory pathway component PulM
MLDHLSKEELEDYRQLNMAPRELLKADDHLAKCDSCHNQLMAISNLQYAFQTIQNEIEEAYYMKPLHIAPDQLLAYTDNQLDEIGTGIVESHLKVCPDCLSELHDLQRFNLTETTPATSQLLNREEQPRFIRRILSKLSSSSTGYWLPLQALGAILLVVLTVWLVRTPLNREMANLKNQEANSTSTDSQMQPKIKEIEKNSNISQQAPLTSDSVEDKNSNRVIASASENSSKLQPNNKDSKRLVNSSNQPKNLPSSYKEEIETALATAKIDRPEIVSKLVGEEERLMGESSEERFYLQSPVGTVIQNSIPTLQWQSLPGASSYNVTILDSNFNEVLTVKDLSTTSWTIPTALKAGEIYSWQVSAIKNGKEITSQTPTTRFGKFKVLEERKSKELNELKTKYTNAHLILSVIYAKEGLIDEAERELNKEISKDPKSPIARKLLNNIEALRRKGTN